MSKKVITNFCLLIFTGFIFLPEIAAYSAKKALKKENKFKPWAPMTAYRAAKINMKFWRYEASNEILMKTVKTFPEENWISDAYYKMAFCYEKSGKLRVAVNYYKFFIKKYPKHVWKDQAAKRATNIEANL